MNLDLANIHFDFTNESAVSCILCPDLFEVLFDPQPILKHLLTSHQFVIGSPNEIADFRQYVLYWSKLRHSSLENYCIFYKTNSEPGAKDASETYCLLCDKLPEDKELRSTIRERKLKFLVQQKEEECRNKGFSRKCIYCQMEITGGVSNCFHHLTFDHGFSLGNPDNIVYGTKLLDILEEKLKRLECLYCEKTFKNHVILREHMRKKQHRSLNPKNKVYDRFYFLSYVKPGVPWEEAKKILHQEKDPMHQDLDAGASDEENYWTDWNEDANILASCLFCPFTTSTIPSGLLCHMSEYHRFHFEELTNYLNFYSKVKLINFIRTKVRLHECINCEDKFNSNDELLRHLESNDHSCLPDSNSWDHPLYLIPVNENDGLLFHLEDKDIPDDDSSSSVSCIEEEFVFPEEVFVVASSSVLGNKRLREEIFVESDQESSILYQCFFCTYSKSGCDGKNLCLSHMDSMHNFNYKLLLQNTDHVQLTSCISYLRFMTNNKQCFVCQKSFLTKCALEEHRILEEHTFLPPSFDVDKYKSLMTQVAVETDGFLLDGLSS